MPIDRNAAVAYARRYWNRPTDDGMFWTSDEEISIAQKRQSLNAPAAQGWEALFVSDGAGGEKAIFRRTSNGQVQEKIIATWDDLDDCTHYVSRCLIHEGIALTETPRANELALAMIRSPVTKTLALKTDQENGQKVIDSGMFKPGDLVAYYSEEKNRYTHTAMFVGNQTGRPDDPGGITCHTVCRFEGLSAGWNGASDDNWYLHDGLSYTLVHFSEDDAPLSAGTLNWLAGWWNVGGQYYFVSGNGRAYVTGSRPTRQSDRLTAGDSVGYCFEDGGGVVVVWRKPAGEVQVERWTAPTNVRQAALTIDGVGANLGRVFQA